jgi:phosphatidylserine decarboxylase
LNIEDKSLIKKTRIENSWPIAREGLLFIILSGLASLLLFYLGLLPYAIPMSIICLFIIYFFRDPERNNNARIDAVLTPADGRILYVRNLNHGNNPLGEPAVMISVFMSLFNVHVNRVPASGRILGINYSPGRFFSANLDKASEQNEKNRITMETDMGPRIVFIQIAGLIARRIACWVKEKDHVMAGQRCGLIRFGSRLDIYIPYNSRIIIKSGDRVKAGETVIGYLS